jgi:O-methyltransferase
MQQINSKQLAIILRELQKTLNLDGDVVELGCYQGDTSLELAKVLRHTDKKLYLYDSFEGLPEKSNADCSSAGENFQLGELKASKAAVTARFKKAGLPLPFIKKAWFSDLKTSDLPNKVCFAFLDGDFYESIRDSLELLNGKLDKDSVVVIDDYQSEALPGVRSAVDEWLNKNPEAKLRIENSLATITI